MDLTVRDVAKILHVSEKTIYRWLTKGKIPAYRLNDQYRFQRHDLLEWIVAHKLNASLDLLEAEAEPRDATPAHPSSVVEALERGGIHYRVGGRSREEALAEAVELLRLPPLIDRAQVLAVLQSRERLGSTAVGGGVAIPHSRHPILPNLGPPLLTLCFLEQPVYWESLDGQPVRVLFPLLAPGLREHLTLLQRLVFALRDTELRAALASEATREELLRHFRRIELNWTATQPTEN